MLVGQAGHLADEADRTAIVQPDRLAVPVEAGIDIGDLPGGDVINADEFPTVIDAAVILPGPAVFVGQALAVGRENDPMHRAAGGEKAVGRAPVRVPGGAGGADDAVALVGDPGRPQAIRRDRRACGRRDSLIVAAMLLGEGGRRHPKHQAEKDRRQPARNHA